MAKSKTTRGTATTGATSTSNRVRTRKSSHDRMGESIGKPKKKKPVNVKRQTTKTLCIQCQNTKGGGVGPHMLLGYFALGISQFFGPFYFGLVLVTMKAV